MPFVGSRVGSACDPVTRKRIARFILCVQKASGGADMVLPSLLREFGGSAFNIGFVRCDDILALLIVVV